MRRLVVISSTPAMLVDGNPFLDIKFVEGMRFYASIWNGPVKCILHISNRSFPFGRTFNRQEISFEIQFMSKEQGLEGYDIQESDLVLASAEDYKCLDLASYLQSSGAKLVYVIENLPQTRRQIILLERKLNFFKKLHSILWETKQEFKRRKAFIIADGVQANGYPAYSRYRALNQNSMMFLDNRLRGEMFASEPEMEERLARLQSGATLRLVHSGRLETLKGSQDLIPIAQRLEAMGIDFTLDIFGAGSLESEIREGIEHHSLHERVHLRGEVDFQADLVPFLRSHADIYLSCHRQSDPSCTYIENMGCGLAVVGYDNLMWSGLCLESAAGWVVPMGKVEKAAEAIAEAARNRDLLVERCISAKKFAQKHSFENEFIRRIKHLQSV
jgi:colanic acid/amylovoran biosynthesis glycosyltransferase